MLCLPKQCGQHSLLPLSKNAIVAEIVVTPTNFQIGGRRTALTSIQFTTKSASATSPQHKSAGREGLMQRLIDAWAGVEDSVIQDVIDHKGVATGGISVYIPQNQSTSKNYVAVLLL